MNTPELYRVECRREGRKVDFYCMAVNRGDAMEQARQEEDPEMGGYLYGEPDTGEPVGVQGMARAVNGGNSQMFPEGNWAATVDAQNALIDWCYEQDTETLDMFAETQQ